MAIDKPLADINEDDFEQLVQNAVTEGRRLEFKREPVLTNSDAARKEFCDDFASFANASGGDIIFGIEEDIPLHIRLQQS